MNNLKPFTAVIAGLVLGMSLPMVSQAGMINDSHWLVKPGDSVYSIARNLFPGNSKQQARLRQELVSSNPQVFKGNPNALSVGARLQLPGFATGQAASAKIAKTPESIRLPQPRPKQKAAPMRVAQKAVTPDPVDNIGRVIINMGELSAVNRGSVRKLVRNSSVLKGDTVKTAHNSHTQIRLKDGALISLRPNTEFRFSDFRYNGSEDGSERVLFELIKGGFRTITGAIGHRNKQNYRVNTTVATIGIRGTHYGLVLCTDGSCATDGSNLADGLYGGVVDGAVVASNSTGEFNFTNDEYFHIASQTTEPTPILNPTLVFDGLSDETEVVATAETSSETISAAGTVTSTAGLEFADIPAVDLSDPATGSVINPSLGDPSNNAPAGSGMVLAFNHSDPSGLTGVAAPVYVLENGTDAIYLETLASGETLPVVAYDEDLDGTTHSISRNTAVPSSLGSVSQIGPSSVPVNVAWGRWQGDFTVLENGEPLEHTQNLHLIYSDQVLDVTDPATIASLASIGGTYNYNSIGGTTTDNLGNDLGQTNVIMTANFSTGNITSFDISTAGGEYQGNNLAPIPFQDTVNSFEIAGTGGTSCGSGCTGEASLAFIGAQAEGAITSYSLTNSDSTSSASGVSLLEQQ
ncbi:MAG: FecR domain-containing protein [Gammaproteobacteria bacterium]